MVHIVRLDDYRNRAIASPKFQSSLDMQQSDTANSVHNLIIGNFPQHNIWRNTESIDTNIDPLVKVFINRIRELHESSENAFQFVSALIAEIVNDFQFAEYTQSNEIIRARVQEDVTFAIGYFEATQIPPMMTLIDSQLFAYRCKQEKAPFIFTTMKEAMRGIDLSEHVVSTPISDSRSAIK